MSGSRWSKLPADPFLCVARFCNVLTLHALLRVCKTYNGHLSSNPRGKFLLHKTTCPTIPWETAKWLKSTEEQHAAVYAKLAETARRWANGNFEHQWLLDLPDTHECMKEIDYAEDGKTFELRILGHSGGKVINLGSDSISPKDDYVGARCEDRVTGYTLFTVHRHTKEFAGEQYIARADGTPAQRLGVTGCTHANWIDNDIYVERKVGAESTVVFSLFSRTNSWKEKIVLPNYLWSLEMGNGLLYFRDNRHERHEVWFCTPTGVITDLSTKLPRLRVLGADVHNRRIATGNNLNWQYWIWQVFDANQMVPLCAICDTQPTTCVWGFLNAPQTVLVEDRLAIKRASAMMLGRSRAQIDTKAFVLRREEKNIETVSSSSSQTDTTTTTASSVPEDGTISETLRYVTRSTMKRQKLS